MKLWGDETFFVKIWEVSLWGVDLKQGESMPECESISVDPE